MASDLQNRPDDDEVVFADEDVIFADEVEDQEGSPQECWKVMIVDDDEEVHNVTRLALGEFSFDGKGLEFISVYSGGGKRGRPFWIIPILL